MVLYMVKYVLWTCFGPHIMCLNSILHPQAFSCLMKNVIFGNILGLYATNPQFWNKIRIKAYNNAKKKYNYKYTAKKYLSLYKKTLKKRDLAVFIIIFYISIKRSC